MTNTLVYAVRDLNQWKEALNLNISECQIPFCDVKPVINSYVNDMRQMEWDECHGNKLYETNPSVR